MNARELADHLLNRLDRPIDGTLEEKEMEPPKVITKRVEVCSPRSVDNYSPIELRRMAAARERMGRVK